MRFSSMIAKAGQLVCSANSACSAIGSATSPVQCRPFIESENAHCHAPTNRASWGWKTFATKMAASSSGVRSIRALPETYDASGDSSSRAGTAAAKRSQ